MAGVTGSIPVAPTIAHHNPLSEFFSLYSHEFVRVACCVPRTRVADAAYNLGQTLRLAAEGDKARTAIMVFPELGLSSYAIEDLLLQDALLDEVEASIAKVVAASNDALPGAGRRRAAARREPALQHRHRHPSRRDPGRGARRSTCRTTASSTRSGISCRAPTCVERHDRLAGQRRRSAPTCCSAPTARVAVTFHVEICEDIWVPVPPSSHAALAGAEVLLNLSASNITIGKAEPRRLLCGSQSARCHRGLCLLGRRARANRRPTSPGTATRRSTNAATSSPNRALREGLDASSRPTSISAASARSGCATTASPTAPRARATRSRASARVDFALDAPAAERGAASGRSSASPTCRRTRPSCATIATRPTTSRSRAWRSACSRAAPRSVIGVSGGLDSTQALIVICRAMDQLGLPREQRHGLHAAGLRHVGQDARAMPGG